MKTIHKIAMLCAGLLLAASCIDDKPVPEEETTGRKQVDPVSLELSFVLPGDAVKTAWAAGDQIVVHGEYADEQVTVTLAAADISADGKTATLKVDNLRPYTVEGRVSTLYAGWPADAVDNLNHCCCYTKFNTTTQELLAACNDADNVFRFQIVTGAFSFTVDDDFDSYTLVANRKEPLGYSFLQVNLTDTESNFRHYVGEPVVMMDLPAKKGVNTIYMPAGTEFANGIHMKFRKGGSFVKQFHFSDPIAIERAQTENLGDITPDLVVYDDPFSADILDLDGNGNANCYVVTAPGKYKFKAVKGNAPSNFVVGCESADVLWETWNDDSEVTVHSVVASASFAEDYVIVTMPDPLKPGNAVVAVRDSDGNILWSWHIWVPETAIVTADYGIYSAQMMDRNLGALVAAPVDGEAPIQSFGLTYQWGRKDPFPGPAVAKKSDNATVAGQQVEQTPGDGAGDESKITLEDAIAHPTLLGHSQNGDWLLPPYDNNLWKDGEKTIYDPCPPGYRVPARDQNTYFHSSDLTTAPNWSESSSLFKFTLGDPVAVFPLAGYRDDYGPDSMTHAYDRAVYWTAYASSEKTGYYVNIRVGSAHKLTEAGKSRAGSVRCVVE